MAAEAEIASARLRGLGEKGVGQQDNVPLALAQRRDTQSQHIDAEVQICPEGALPDHRDQITVGGSNNADVNGNGSLSTNAADAVLLQDTQQLALHGGRDLTDLIQKNSSGMSTLEQAPLAVPAGSGKGSLYIAEQLTFRMLSGREAQLTATNGMSRRRLAR